MAENVGQVIAYKRSRFSTRLPVDRRYTLSHFWVKEMGEGVWRVGFTKFAVRMLGDLVEQGFQVVAGDAVKVGQAIGWVEGFKAITDMYCVAEGVFVGGNAELKGDPTLMDSDPYGKGWLYEVRGEPEKESVDVGGYIAILDATIEKMQEKQGDGAHGQGEVHDDRGLPGGGKDDCGAEHRA